jgi:hypothetical protein
MSRDEMIEKLADDAVNSATKREDLRWYVVEYFRRLADVDLQHEFRDAGLGE